MRSFNSEPVARRNLRFTGSLPSILQSITGAGRLYIHAKNRMAELAAITPLPELIIDSNENTAFFPEQGLHLALGAIEAAHGVTIDFRARDALALELATRGEPRALSIAAIPNISDLECFSQCLNHHPAKILREEEYQQWQENSFVRPALCPCCVTAAERRRENPEQHPLAEIFRHGIEAKLELRCSLISPAMEFTTWLAPVSLQFSDGILGVIAADGNSMLEVDLGACHGLRIICRLLDDEPFSEMTLFDTVGMPHLRIGVRGWDNEAIWRGLCDANS